MEGISGEQCQYGETLAEWRSSEQLETGTPSTAPLYLDSYDDNDDGPKPSELHGKHTWNIEKFSQITEREVKSQPFEAGGYKWYILIYPQGCDVCNHISLFLSVADHDKLLPGWSHFAQFTITVVNKDPKKNKFSDTLHRFWKKEHDWGWKKFLELPRVHDGFVDADTLIIKAQVQVIRDKADRPFRCLDCQYRRELLRMYLTNVEQICRRFVEDRRSKLGKLIEDKARWLSFCSFWKGIDQNSRRLMSREKTDVILKVVVKHFFVEKEVTSTLVMDSLYSGLKALEGQNKCRKGRMVLLDVEEMPAPIVHMENDMFVLVEDVLGLLEKAAIEPVPPKDENGPQNRTKDGNSGEDFNRDFMKSDERRLTELGRRTVEIFVLAHIFSNKIEVAYQEAVALKRQEELIREEEAAACHAESEQKAKRGLSEKEKKAKKKQAKHKRNNRKGKDKGREERPTVHVRDKQHEANPNDEKNGSNSEELQTPAGKSDVVEYVSDVSDSVDGVAEMLRRDSEERVVSLVNGDTTDTSEVHSLTDASSSGVNGLASAQQGLANRKSNSIMDDSSSTCSTDSLPSVVINSPYNGNWARNYKIQKSPSRGKNRGKVTSDGTWANEIDNQPSSSTADAVDLIDGSGSAEAGESEPEFTVISPGDQNKWIEQQFNKEEVVLLQKKIVTKDKVDIERPDDVEGLPNKKMSMVLSSPRSPPGNLPPEVQMSTKDRNSTTLDLIPFRKASSNGIQRMDKEVSLSVNTSSLFPAMPRPEIQRAAARLAEKSMAQQVPVMSRPSSAPLVLASRPSAPAVSMGPATPPLPRSVSAAGRLGPESSPATHSYVPHSYRNATVGNTVTSTSANFTRPSLPGSGVNPSSACVQPPSLVSSPMFLPHCSESFDSNTGQSGVPFSMVRGGVLPNGPQCIESSQREAVRNIHFDSSSHLTDVQNQVILKPLHSRSQSDMTSEHIACTSGLQAQGLLVDEFPHLDIINDLLDDEHAIGRASSVFQSLSTGQQLLNRHFTVHGDLSMSGDMGSSNISCRIERLQSYHDHGFQGGFSTSSGHYDPLRNYVPQTSQLPYLIGQVDGSVPNQWQVAGSDLSYLGIRNGEMHGYPHFTPDYSNTGCGINGFTVLRSSNGH